MIFKLLQEKLKARVLTAATTLLFTILSGSIYGQLNITTTATTYGEDFNTLISAGSATWSDNSTLPNWYHARTGTGTTIIAGTGSSNTGALYSFGNSPLADRALGSIGSGNAAAGSFYWGVRIANNTGLTITSLDISFIGEQWRASAITSNTVNFYYKTANVPITSLGANTTGYTAESSLNFISPVLTTVGAIDGNSSTNRTLLTGTLNVTLNSGDEIMLKWEDIDHTGSDHGMAIDSFRVKANAGAPCSPTQLIITAINGLKPVNAITANQGFSVAIESRDAGNNPCNVLVNTPVSINILTGTGTLSGTVSGIINTGSSTTTLTGVIYNTVETGISLTADDGPGGLTAVNSSTFRSLGIIENILPQYIQGVNGTNLNRIPYAYRVSVSGLNPNTNYRFYNQVDTLDCNPNSNGAGNCIFVRGSGNFSKTTSPGFTATANYDSLTTDGTGNYSGWFITEPTGNVRFSPDSIINMRILLNDGAGGTTEFYRILTTSGVTVKSLGSNTNQGTAIYSYTGGTSKNFVMLYDNTTGAGRPLSGTFLEDDNTDNTTSYANFYGANVDGINGAWGSLLPNILPGGLMRVEQRSRTTGTIVGCPATDANGIWPSGVNTINPSGGGTELVLDQFLDDPLGTPNASASNNGPSCEGGNISLNASGGASYSWTGPASYSDTTQNPVLAGVTPSMSGTYTVTVSDITGCTATATTEVLVHASPVVLAGNDGPACEGGTVTLSSSVGNSYLWSGPLSYSSIQQNPVLNSVLISQAGTYTVTVTNIDGCTSSATTNVVVYPVPYLTTLNNVNNLCPDTTVDLTLIIVTDTNNTTGVLSYYNTLADANSGTNALSLIQAQSVSVTGIYYIRKTTNSEPACFDVTYVNVTINSCSCTPPSLSETHVNVSCNGGSNGSINLSVNSGTPPFTYSWSNGSSTEDIASLQAGTYTVTVTDAQPCSAVSIITITESAVLVGTLSQTDVTCFGGSNGILSLNVTGGIQPYVFTWSNGSSSQNQSGLTSGTYTYTVTDAVSCTTTGNVILTEPSAISIIPVVTNIDCNGGVNGSVSLTVSGGTPLYSYLWSNGETVQSPNALIAGTYTVTVTDVSLCTNTLSVTLTEPSLIQITPAVTNVTCPGAANGSINISVSGGTGTYTFNWSNGATVQNQVNLSAGAYSVTVTDQNLCNTTAVIEIVQPAAIILQTVLSNATCSNSANGNINLTAGGGTPGYSYNWSNGVTTEDNSGLTPGSYTVTVTDANNCTQSLSVNVSGSTAITTNLSVTNQTCGFSDGAVAATVTGGTPTGSNTPGLIISEYLANPAGTDSPFEWVEFIATKPINFAVTPYSVIWANNGSGTTKGWKQGLGITYAFEITTGIVNTGDVVYVGGTSMSPTGTKLRMINTGTTGGDGSLGSFNSSGVLGNGGTNADAIGVFNLPVSSLDSNTVPVDAVFFGSATGSAVVNGGTSGYQLPVNDLYPGGKLQAGSFLAPDPASAQFTRATGTFDITGNTFSLNRVWINVVSFTDNASAIQLTNLPATNYLYNWSNGNTTSAISSLTTSVYTVTVTDANGCTATVSGTVQLINQINLTLNPAILYFGNYGVSCHGGNDGGTSLTVTGNPGPFSYLWNTGATTQNITSLTAGSYTVTVSNGSCEATSTITLTEPPQLTLLMASTPTGCTGNDGTASVTANGSVPAYTYNWSNGNSTNSAIGLVPGAYTVTVTDQNGCSATGSTQVTASAVLNVLVTKTNVTCKGGTNGTLQANPSGGNSPYSYQWSNGSTSISQVAVGPGTYTVTVTDQNGCTATGTAKIIQPAISFIINSSKTNIRCFGAASGVAGVSPAGGSAPYTYSWNTIPVKTTSSVSGLNAGVYTCTVTDAGGCTKTVTITITQPPQLSIIPSQTNVSSPGGNDGTATVIVSGGVPLYTYSWNTVPVKTTNTVSGLIAGIYKCTIKDSKGCTKKQTFTITEPSSKSPEMNASEKFQLNIFPNPSAGLVTVAPKGLIEEEDLQLMLVDLSGRVLYELNAKTYDGSYIILDFTQLAKGMYFLRCKSANQYAEQKLVIQ